LEDIRLDTPWNEEKVDPCAYVNEGDEVVINVGSGRARRGKVTCAAGHHCRVEVGGRERWVHVEDCARLKKDVEAR